MESALIAAGAPVPMDVLRIIFRMFSNFLRDLPLTPRKFRVRHRLRRRVAAWRLFEVERLDRIRNPAKYRGSLD